MSYRHLTSEERLTIKGIVERTGYAEVLQMLAQMIRVEVPNTTESWQNGDNAWADDMRHTLCMIAHKVYRKIDNPEGK
jgi:hypothetical protein